MMRARNPSIAALPPPRYRGDLPTEAEIREQCLIIQATWSEREREFRIVGRVDEHVTAPEIRTADIAW